MTSRRSKVVGGACILAAAAGFASAYGPWSGREVASHTEALAPAPDPSTGTRAALVRRAPEPGTAHDAPRRADQEPAYEDHGPVGLASGQAVPELFPSTTEAGRLLNAHARVAVTPFATLDEGQRAHDASLAKLREHAKEASRMLADRYASLPAAHYTSRWVAASTLSELESDEAYKPLREIALQALPKPAEEPQHHDDRQDYEMVMRMVSTDGLATLARNGNQRAEADLWAMASGSIEADSALRARAAMGYVHAGEDRALREARVRQVLPEDLQWAASAGELPEPLAAALAVADSRTAPSEEHESSHGEQPPAGSLRE